jgi:transcription factor SPN1
LDNGILEAIRLWLEPYDDAVLPSVDLQISLLDSLAKMKIETDHLKESGIGKIIMFMYNCPRFIPEVKRKAGDLISKWCKPILRASSAATASKNENSDEENQRPAKRLVVKRGEKDLEIDMERVHASIPQPALFDYPVRPKSKIDVAEIKEASKDKNSRFQDFAGKISKKSKSALVAKLIKPSVEGKGLI